MIEPYRILNVKEGCSETEVLAAHASMIEKTKPLVGMEGYEKLVENINESKEILLSPSERKAYDKYVDLETGVNNNQKIVNSGLGENGMSLR